MTTNGEWQTVNGELWIAWQTGLVNVAIMTIFMALAERIKTQLLTAKQTLLKKLGINGRAAEKKCWNCSWHWHGIWVWWGGQQLLSSSPQRHLQHLIYYANVNKWPEWPKMTVDVSNGWAAQLFCPMQRFIHLYVRVYLSLLSNSHATLLQFSVLSASLMGLATDTKCLL